MLLSQFFAGFLAGSPRGTPSFHEADEGSREALLPNQVSLINLASIHDFERVARQPVDPRRFRGNFLLEDLPAWDDRKSVVQGKGGSGRLDTGGRRYL